MSSYHKPPRNTVPLTVRRRRIFATCILQIVSFIILSSCNGTKGPPQLMGTERLSALSSHGFYAEDQVPGTIEGSTEISNTGSAAIGPLELSTSCGCLTLDGPSRALTLAAHQKFAVRFRYQVGLLGKQTQTIFVRRADVIICRIPVTVVTVAPFVDSTSKRVEMPPLRRAYSSAWSAPATFRLKLGQHVKLVRLKTSCSWIKLEQKAEGGELVGTVRATPSADEGPYNAPVSVYYSTARSEGMTTISFTGSITSDLISTPETLDWGIVSLTKPSPELVASISWKKMNWRSLTVQSTSKDILTRVISNGPESLSLGVRLRQHTTGNLKCCLKILVLKHLVAVIPIRAYVIK